jgi:hypothetical protein
VGGPGGRFSRKESPWPPEAKKIDFFFVVEYNITMFGLMKPHHCSVSVNKEEKRRYRFYYCGICKTIACRYGHKMRLFLNHDITFFAEVLAELSGKSKEENQWSPAFYRSNCFVLPGKQDRIPLPFSIAAAVNILLAKLTIADKVDDSRRTTFFWKWVKARISKPELNALEQLEAWKFPLERIFNLAHQQKIREQEPHKYSGAEAALDYFSESTAVITGIIFQNAARISGKKLLMRDMFTLGFLGRPGVVVRILAPVVIAAIAAVAPTAVIAAIAVIAVMAVVAAIAKNR